MGRKRKLFLGTEPIGGKDMKSRRKARFVTSQYHSIRNEITAIEKDDDILAIDKERKKKVLDEKLIAIGGVDKYQQASIISTSHFKTSRWVVTTLEALGLNPSTRKASSGSALESATSSSKGNAVVCSTTETSCTHHRSSKLKVLEVGAINIQLQQCRWLDVRAIDVNSQHPSIEECDFFDVTPIAEFDAVVCSMVINCVTEPTSRGEMLARLYAHIKPVTGVLFLVLPLRCINSRHVGSGRFDSLLQGLGFEHLIEKRLTPRLVFYILCRDRGVGKNEVMVQRETVAEEEKVAIIAADGTSKKKCKIKEACDSDKDDGKRQRPFPLSVSLSQNWRDLVRTSAANHMMKKGTMDYFCKDFTSVPSVEFCLSMATVLKS